MDMEYLNGGIRMTVDEVYNKIDSICKSSSNGKEDALVVLILVSDFTNLQKFLILAYLDSQYGIKLNIPEVVTPRISYN